MGSSPPRRGNHAATDVGSAHPDDSMIVAMSERGRVGRDERGQAQWKWVTETEAPADPNADTFDFLKAVDSWELAIEQTHPERALEEPTVTGYNPYAKPK